MTWIKVVSREDAEQSDPRLHACYQDLDALYPPEYQTDAPAVQRPDGTSDSILAAHSLLPEVMRPIFTAHALLLSPELPLTRRQHEMISTVVSALNRCVF